MSELRAQERRECERLAFDCVHVEDGEECPDPELHCIGEPGERIGDEPPCDGCNGDGTRWVTVGELRESSLWVELSGDDFNVFTAEPVGDGTTYIRRLYIIEADQ